MKDVVWLWPIRVMWLALPFTAGPLFGDALADSARAVQITATVGAWVFWSVGLLLSLIPHVTTLTPFRIIVPGALGCVVWATFADGVSGSAIAALAIAAGLFVTTLLPAVGSWFINGSSYGDERRIPLRPPGQLLLGPIPLAWVGTVVAIVAAPILFASQQWIIGAVVAVVGGVIAVFAVRALDRLARRWLVFVPAGIVIHDRLTVSDPALFKRTALVTIGPALADTAAVDLTAGALGLALEIRLRSSVELTFRDHPGQDSRTDEVNSITISASRPGAALDEAKRRHIPVG